MDHALLRRPLPQTLLRHRFGALGFWGTFHLALSLLLRLALLGRSTSELDASLLDLAGIFAVGFLFDLVATAYALAAPALLLAALPEALFRSRAWPWLIRAATFAVVALLLLNALSEWLFWTEFGARYNFIAVDYLVYTREVLGNLRESYPVRDILLGVGALALGVALLLRRQIAQLGTEPLPFRRRIPWALGFTAAPLVCFLALDAGAHRFSPNATANELAKNGLYELFAAYRNNVLDYEQFYRKAPPELAMQRLRRLLGTPEATFTGAGIERRIAHQGPERRLNVALISVESLSADFMGLFGNPKKLTPELDALAARSLAFMNVYATGTRTVRGLEALTLSVPPTPGQSIVRRPSNEDLFSLGRVFAEKGYENKFLYGGYGYFDNMNYFFAHNGYAVVDRTGLDASEVDLETIWGVADENLFTLALRELDRSAQLRKPFFAHIMTTSNHRPFLYPPGRVPIPSGEGREGAVQYSDYAIGKFIREAQSRSWFEDTVFVIIADHCAASAGRTELPVSRYHIPLLIHSPAHVKPGRVDRLMSQIDLAPTLLGILNFSYTSHFFGYDLFALEPGRERAFISTYQSLGYLHDNRLVQLDPRRGVKCFAVDLATGRSLAEADEPGLIADAVSWYETASRAFKTGQMRRR